MKLSDYLIALLRTEVMVIFQNEIKEWDIPKGFDIEQLVVDKYLPVVVDRVEYYVNNGLSYFIHMSLKEEKENNALSQKKGGKMKQTERIAYYPVNTCRKCDWFIESAAIVFKSEFRTGLCGNPHTYVGGNLRPVATEIPKWCPFVKKEKPDNVIE